MPTYERQQLECPGLFPPANTACCGRPWQCDVCLPKLGDFSGTSVPYGQMGGDPLYPVLHATVSGSVGADGSYPMTIRSTDFGFGPYWEEWRYSGPAAGGGGDITVRFKCTDLPGHGDGTFGDNYRVFMTDFGGLGEIQLYKQWNDPTFVNRCGPPLFTFPAGSAATYPGGTPVPGLSVTVTE